MNQSPRSPRIRPAAGAALLAGTSLVLLVLIFATVEFVAGQILAGMAPAQPQGVIEGDTISRTLAYLDINPAPLVADADLLWRNEPEAERVRPVNPRPFGTEAVWSIENNSLGFRGPETTPIPEPGAYRILCIGDSITYGFNADQAASYPQQLSDALHKRYPGGRFEVINAGVPGWSWMQGLKFLETRGLALRPDLVVMGHGTNDQFFAAKITDEERLRMLDGFAERSVRKAVQMLASTNLYRLVGPTPSRSEDQFSRQCLAQMKGGSPCKRVSVLQIEAAVKEVARVTAAAGVDLLLVNTDFLETPSVQGSAAAATELNLRFLNLVEEMSKLRREDEDARAERLGLAKAPPAGLTPGKMGTPGTKRIVMRTVVPNPSRTYRLEGRPYLQPGEAFAATARDDGKDGDEKAGDGVFSAAVDLPMDVRAFEYRFFQDDVADFTPLPPMASTLGQRLLRCPTGGFGPVEIFGVSLFMAERAHPNRHGHEAVVSLIMGELPEVASFERYLHPVGSRPLSAGDGE